MKLKLTLLLVLLSFSIHAKYMKATLLFRNGELESGYIKSFLENDFFDFGLTFKIEKEFNLDDKTIKFKLTEDGEVKTYTIEEIKEVRIHNIDDSGYSAIYVSLPLKTINKKGEIVELLSNVWLPLVKEGKINIYGFQYSYNSFGYPTEYYSKFYFQKPDSDFALDPFDKMTLLSKKANGLIIMAFYNYLFQSCPEFYQANYENFRKDAYNDSPKKERKDELRVVFELEKLYNKNPNYRTIEIAFKLNFYKLSQFLEDFHKSDCD